MHLPPLPLCPSAPQPHLPMGHLQSSRRTCVQRTHTFLRRGAQTQSQWFPPRLPAVRGNGAFVSKSESPPAWSSRFTSQEPRRGLGSTESGGLPGTPTAVARAKTLDLNCVIYVKLYYGNDRVKDSQYCQGHAYGQIHRSTSRLSKLKEATMARHRTALCRAVAIRLRTNKIRTKSSILFKSGYYYYICRVHIM